MTEKRLPITAGDYVRWCETTAEQTKVFDFEEAVAVIERLTGMKFCRDPECVMCDWGDPPNIIRGEN